MQITLIVLITLVTTVSVMAGVSRGMKRLSEWNMLLSVVLVVLILLLGPTRYIINLMLESTGDYASHVVGLSFGAIPRRTAAGRTGGRRSTGRGG